MPNDGRPIENKLFDFDINEKSIQPKKAKLSNFFKHRLSGKQEQVIFKVPLKVR